MNFLYKRANLTRDEIKNKIFSPIKDWLTINLDTLCKKIQPSLKYDRDNSRFISNAWSKIRELMINH